MGLPLPYVYGGRFRDGVGKSVERPSQLSHEVDGSRTLAAQYWECRC